MSRRLCRSCQLPFANAAAHVPTPDLVDPLRDAAVYWCEAAGRHVTVPLSWSDELRRALHRGRRLVEGRA